MSSPIDTPKRARYKRRDPTQFIQPSLERADLPPREPTQLAFQLGKFSRDLLVHRACPDVNAPGPCLPTAAVATGTDPDGTEGTSTRAKGG